MVFSCFGLIESEVIIDTITDNETNTINKQKSENKQYNVKEFIKIIHKKSTFL